MKNYKYLPVILILLIFIIFSCTQIFKSKSYDVLKVITPLEIVVDKNYNGEIDDNETVKIKGDYQYFGGNKALSKSLGIDDYTERAFYYLTKKYFNDVLLDKRIILKSNNQDIFVGGENYENILYKSGYIFKDNKPINQSAYNKRLAQIAKAEYKIYNVKSNKYHKLTCEYGQKSHNYVLLAKYQLPKGAQPCKYCLGEKIRHHKKEKHTSAPKTPPLTYSNGAIKIFVTDYTRNLIPNRHGNTEICRELVRQINSAKSTIDMAIYGYDRVPVIEQALKKALERGVKIRLVRDIDSKGHNIYANTDYFESFIKNSASDRAPSGMKKPYIYTNSIMHNKFYIFDNSVVMTGSANLSHTDMSAFNSNCVLLIKSQKIANIYTQEFNQMYNHKFHNLKQKIADKENIVLGTSNLSIYYSPTDRISQTVILPLINSAKKYIYMPVFLITDQNIANALINAKHRGVDVKVIVDATNAHNTASQHKILRQAGIPVKTENYAGKLHSKSIIIDDKVSVIGSMNFSKSGELKNDENVIVLKNTGITKFYKQFFLYLWNRISDYWLTHDVGAESVYSIGSCTDGIDNDYDGKIDMADEGCKFRPKKLRK